MYVGAGRDGVPLPRAVTARHPRDPRTAARHPPPPLRVHLLEMGLPGVRLLRKVENPCIRDYTSLTSQGNPVQYCSLLRGITRRVS